MIVRIATEGQYEVSDELLDELNEIDNRCVEAVEGGDEATFHATFDEMIRLVREGKALEDDDLHESALILPPADLSFAEAGEQFTGEGLIPD